MFRKYGGEPFCYFFLYLSAERIYLLQIRLAQDYNGS